MYKILFLALIAHGQIGALVVESNNLNDVFKYLKKKPKGTVVVFDIDNTMAKVSMGIEPWVWYKTKQLTEKGLSYKEAFDLVLTMFFTVTELTELLPIGNSPAVVQVLQAKEIPVIALTNRSIPIARRTAQRLKKIGIDLTRNSLFKRKLPLAVTHDGIYLDGIIFSGYNDKGKMLFQFFKTIGYNPKKIILFDDRPENVTSVQKACQQNKKQFVGVRFSLMDHEKKNFNPAQAEKTIYRLKQRLGFNPL